MTFVILGIAGAVIIAAVSVAGLLISAEADMRDNVSGTANRQAKLR